MASCWRSDAKPSVTELDRLIRLLAVERDEFRTNPDSAKLILGRKWRCAGDPRSGGGCRCAARRSAIGGWNARLLNRIGVDAKERAGGRQGCGGEKRAVAIAAMKPAEIADLAGRGQRYVAGCSSNLDDFITRN